jgi:hypothetical protein
MGYRFGVQLQNLDACSKVPLAAQSRSAGLRMPRGGKRVSEGVAARRLCHPRGHHGPANLFLNDRAIEVVAPLLPTAFPNPAARSLACRSLPRCHHHGHPPLHACPHQSSTPPSRLPPPNLQPDQGWSLTILKVAVHGIPDLPLPLLQSLCLSVNKDADGAGNAYGNPP